eukprot:ANDGO_00743.mRNA.1 hypothetical protein
MSRAVLSDTSRQILSSVVVEESRRIASYCSTLSFGRYLRYRPRTAWWRLGAVVFTLVLMLIVIVLESLDGVVDRRNSTISEFAVLVFLVLLGLVIDFREWYLQNSEMLTKYRSHLSLFGSRVSAEEKPFSDEVAYFLSFLCERGYFEHLNAYQSLIREVLWPVLQEDGSFALQHALLCVKGDVIHGSVATWMPDYLRCHSGIYNAHSRNIVSESEANPITSSIHQRSQRFSVNAASFATTSSMDRVSSFLLGDACPTCVATKCIVLDETPLFTVSEIILTTVREENERRADRPMSTLVSQFRKVVYPLTVLMFAGMWIVYGSLFGPDSIIFVVSFLYMVMALEYPVILHALYWIGNAFLVAQWHPSFWSRGVSKDSGFPGQQKTEGPPVQDEDAFRVPVRGEKLDKVRRRIAEEILHPSPVSSPLPVGETRPRRAMGSEFGLFQEDVVVREGDHGRMETGDWSEDDDSDISTDSDGSSSDAGVPPEGICAHYHGKSGTEHDTLPEMQDFRKLPLPIQKTPGVALILKSLWNVISASPTCLVRSRNPVENLGCATIFSFVHRDGILGKTHRTPEQITFLTEAGEATTLHLSYEESYTNRISFSDPDWHNHIESLKPLGLQFLMHAPERRFFDGVLHTHRSWRQLLCLLAKEIGFEAGVLSQYHPVACLSKEAGSVIELQIETAETGTQILLEGCGDRVLAHCAEYFCGNDIKPLSTELRKELLTVLLSWIRQQDIIPVAFACRNVDDDETNSSSPPLAVSASTPSGMSTQPEGTAAATSELTGRGVRVRQPYAGEEHGQCEVCSSLLRNVGMHSEEDAATSSHLNSSNIELHMQTDELDGESASNTKSSAVQPDIFIGFAGFGLRVRRSAPQFAQMLHDAGIRFVYFGEESERRTKSFGAKLGLETDWNSCISLEPHKDAVSLDLSDLKAHLPHGIPSIRDHLQDVDDVPLLVSLFCDSRPEGVADMTSIYHENGDIVCCVGNASSLRHLKTFLTADVTLGTAPHFTSWILPDGLPTSSVSVAATLPHTHLFECLSLSLYEARRVAHNVRLAQAAWVVLISALMTLFAISAIALGIAPPVSGTQLLFVICVVCPLLILPLVNTDVDPNILKTLPEKNRQVQDPWFYGGLWALRVLPSAIFLAFLHAWLIFTFHIGLCSSSAANAQSSNDGPSSFGSVFWTEKYGTAYLESSKSYSPLSLTSSVTDCHSSSSLASVVADANATVLWILTLYSIFLVSGFIHRTQSLWQFSPWKNNRTWCMIAIITLGLQSLMSGLVWPIPLSRIPVEIWVIAMVAWPIVLLLTTEASKARDAKLYVRNQKRLRIVFDTRLGMHSPV